MSSFINQSHATESVARDLAKKSQQFLQRSVNQITTFTRLGVSPVQPSVPDFVTAPVFPPKILSAKSWESLADGIPMEEVVSPPEEEIESI